MLMSGVRWLVAGSLLVGLLKARGAVFPARSAWGPLAILGLLLMGLGNGAVVWAEQTVPSGLTSLLVAMAPFWMVGIEALIPGGARLTLRQAAGLLIGFAGIGALVGPDLRLDGSSGFLRGVLATQIACVGWAVGSVYSKRRRPEENVLAAVSVEMLFGGLWLMIAAALRQEWTVVAFSLRSVSALIYLIVVGSVVGFSAYAYALKHLPVATVSTYAYINPLIAVGLGVIVLGEAVSGRIVAAAAMVLAGIFLVRKPEFSSDHPAPADQSYQEEHDRDHKQDIDEVSHRVAADHSQQPQHDQNDRNGFKH
jgi:drug/metabolite transporter (DMT)-like permease